MWFYNSSASLLHLKQWEKVANQESIWNINVLSALKQHDLLLKTDEEGSVHAVCLYKKKKSVEQARISLKWIG